MTNKYTTKEIRLYEILAKLNKETNNLNDLIADNLSSLAKSKDDSFDNFISKLMKITIDLHKIFDREAKIPKKFLILRDLK